MSCKLPPTTELGRTRRAQEKPLGHQEEAATLLPRRASH